MKIELKSTQRLCVINLLAVFKYYPIQNVFDTNGKGGAWGVEGGGGWNLAKNVQLHLKALLTLGPK